VNLAALVNFPLEIFTVKVQFPKIDNYSFLQSLPAGLEKAQTSTLERFFTNLQPLLPTLGPAETRSQNKQIRICLTCCWLGNSVRQANIFFSGKDYQPASQVSENQDNSLEIPKHSPQTILNACAAV
jgi:hypothetical protein